MTGMDGKIQKVIFLDKNKADEEIITLVHKIKKKWNLGNLIVYYFK